MTAEAPWVSGLRAEALAKLLLTEREDLEVVTEFVASPRISYDLLVRVRGTDLSPAPEFAVEVKGLRGEVDRLAFDRVARDALSRLGDADLPICLFVFQVDRREGFYSWLSGAVDAVGDQVPRDPGKNDIDGIPSHGVSLRDRTLHRLDEHAVDDIVKQVISWRRQDSQVPAH